MLGPPCLARAGRTAPPRSKNDLRTFFTCGTGRSSVRAAYLDEARQEDVSHAVRDVLHDRGALVSDHSSSRVLFRDYRPSGKYTWGRGGHVGIHQHAGEREIEVRLRLRARWPWRLLWISALIGVIATITTIIINPSGTVWSMVAAVTAFLLITTGLLYLNTWKPVWREERDLMDALEAKFEAGFGTDDVESDEERETREFEERLAAELEKRRITEARKAEPKERRGPSFTLPKPKFNIRRKDAEAPAAEASEETPEQKRERLLARKAELQAQTAADEEAPKKKRRINIRAPKLALPKFGKKDEAPEAETEETPEARRARLLARKAELEAQRDNRN